ncbi:protodermal factor 1-like [Phalaenopsis equestris]|uniref:protodermal factor 1-like n=1 Tax=Phalaenopsis equestris TaxID=78828 RepID=UPI0009E2BACC|nr:protodermal factor 1-like [Phalaenopsis equestris]
MGMEREKKKMDVSVLFCVLSVSRFCWLASGNVAEVENQKNYYLHDQTAWSSPRHSHNSRPDCTTPTTPSGGGGGIHYSPPTTPSHGGGITHSPPSAPSHGGSGGGCNCNTPPSITPTPLVPLNPPSPTTPIYLSPPSPLLPFSPPPSTPNPTPPYIPIDPNSPPFPCSYWFAHPTAIWVLFGYWGTVGTIFGTTPATGIAFGRNLSLLEALGNTRDDGYGALLREGTASLLNSMASKSFFFNTEQVREGFNAAVQSEKMAADQANIFQKANEGRLKH